MTRRTHRSSKLRKVRKRVPGGVSKKRYTRRKTTHAQCERCNTRLQGVTTKKKLPLSKKHAGRKYSGSLCPKCTESRVKRKARQVRATPEGYA